MSTRIVAFEELATPQRVTQITARSVNVTPWRESGRTDFVIHPDLSALATEETDGALTFIVPRRDWKHEAGAIVEWTQAEKDARTTAEAAAQAAADAARLVAIRAAAAVGMDEFEVEPLIRRAVADILKGEINALREWLTDFKADVAAATSLGDLQTRVALRPNMPDRTLAQFRTQIAARVNDGTVDA